MVVQEIVSLYNSITSFCENLANDITAINAYAKAENEASIIEYNNLLVKICELQKILKDIALDSLIDLPPVIDPPTFTTFVPLQFRKTPDVLPEFIQNKCTQNLQTRASGQPSLAPAAMRAAKREY